MIIVNGNEIAQKILNNLKLRIQKHPPAKRFQPHLAVVLVGSDPASQTYVRKKQEAANSIGVKFSLYKYPSTITQDKLISEIKKIQNAKLSGIIVQLPLPKNLDKKKVLNALNPEIDVDFLTWESLGKLVVAENVLVPPSPGAILEILKYYKVNVRGKHVVLVGQGDLIGKPLTNLFIHMPVTLTTCNKDTVNLGEITRKADILITGIGKANLIRGSMVKANTIVIDAGVSFKGKKMYGDINFKEVAAKALIVTPTPGGVGPITVAKLLENTVVNARL